jgi:adenylate cyclase
MSLRDSCAVHGKIMPISFIDVHDIYVDCTACGMQLRADAKFCDECGAAVSVAGPPAEYKQVTVLFADVVHSMDIAAAVGSERLREMMSDLYDRCSEVVQRYDGSLGLFTGDGIMAVFGAPMSMEDHAIRACLAALDIQKQASDLAVGVRQQDGIDLRLRVGLNSGEVIAGEVGSRQHSYSTIGEQVGMAQRMESTAPPGAVMLSSSTARLVAHAAVVGERQLVRIKGAEKPVPAYELISVTGRRTDGLARRSTFVGREWELAALTAMLERSDGGHGCVASVVGPPGIGKSRIVAEIAEAAARRGLQVSSTYCESHTVDVPFQAATRLMRSAWGVDGLDDRAARDVVVTRVPGAHTADLVLLYDALGIRDPADPLPDIAPEARRRRLTALVNASVVARPDPALYILEDAHWIDSSSESLLADFLKVVPRARSLVLITYRPEYTGALSRSPGAQTIALAPLDDLHITGMLTELLGSDPSTSGLVGRIAERASGNPFFAEEIVRDLADRGVLRGERGRYVYDGEGSDVEVPATLQAAIASRIDRLPADAKAALNAASVVGLRFDEGLLAALNDRVAVEPLLKAELIDQVTFTRRAEYAFRHPLIRSVAYRSQLAAARADLHRRLASALEERDPELADENSALIAEHLEAAGDLAAAFAWHMRAGDWYTFRDISAGRLSWERASRVADRMNVGQPGREAMRIEPRAVLCASAFRAGTVFDEAAYEETYRLAEAAGDQVSLAMTMSGRVTSFTFGGRFVESSFLATELVDSVQTIGQPELELTLLPCAIISKLAVGDLSECLRLTQRVIDLADGDARAGGLLTESPLSLALMFRATARMCQGALGWHDDLAEASKMVREHMLIGSAILMYWKYAYAISAGAVLPDAAAVQETAELLELAQQRGDDLSLECARFLYGFVLAQQTNDDRTRGLDLLAGVREAVTAQRSLMVYLPLIEIEFARSRGQQGDVDGAVDALNAIFRRAIGAGGVGPHVRATEVLVETLLQRGRPDDIDAAREAVDRVAAVPMAPGVVVYEVSLLRLRALLARACGDDAGYLDYRNRYRAMAEEIGFEGHIAIAAAMA